MADFKVLKDEEKIWINWEEPDPGDIKLLIMPLKRKALSKMYDRHTPKSKNRQGIVVEGTVNAEALGVDIIKEALKGWKNVSLCGKPQKEYTLNAALEVEEASKGGLSAHIISVIMNVNELNKGVRENEIKN